MKTSELAPPAVITLDIDPECRVIGELTVTSDSRDVVLLLHDEGSDLDGVRGIARRLQSAGFSTLAVDLPGHGMSTGTLESHGAAAIDASLALIDPARERGRWLVAMGRSVERSLKSDVAVNGTVWVDPVWDPVDVPSPAWRTRPALILVDPEDTASDRVAERLVAQHRAWAIRAFIHRDDRGRRDQHITAMTARFLLEQGELRRQRLKKRGDKDEHAAR